jgi:hypothetical protein
VRQLSWHFVAPAGAQTASPAKVGTFNPTQASFLLDANGNLSWDGGPPDMCFPWGSANHSPPYKPVVGDWNGSGTRKIGIFDPGNATWLLDYNGDGVFTPGVDKQFQWGQAGDIPVVGDWNGSGTTKIGTWNPSSMTFTLDYNGNFSYDGPIVDRYVTWGQHTTDLPVVGDWNGTGTMKIGTFDRTAALWTLDFNGSYVFEPTVDKLFPWGSTVDRPVVGDWNGSGTTKVGVVTANDEVWLLDYNGNLSWDGPGIDKCVPWGSAGDAPAIGDWNSSSTMKAGTLGPTTALWLLDYNGNFIWDGAAVDKYFAWGAPGDLPVVGNWGPLEPVTVTANQLGVALTIDGTVYSSPQVFQWPAGSAHTIGVSSPQSVGGTQYTFTNWSDSRPQTHTVAIPYASANYTAYFTASPPLAITTTSPLPDGTLSTTYNSSVFPGFTATGGSGAYTWSLSSGQLPRGLTLTSSGVLSTGSGTLRMAGAYTFAVMVTDSANTTATKTFYLNVDVPAVITNLAQLQDCIGPVPQGAVIGSTWYGMTCQLAPQLDASGNPLPYDVVPFTDLDGNPRQQLTIGRSGYVDPGNQVHWLIIEGATGAGNNEAILRRGSASLASIMKPSSSTITLVWIQYLTFDGNRYGFGTGGQGISCQTSSQTQLVDLNLAPADLGFEPFGLGGIFTVWYVDFINAPETALFLGGQANAMLNLASTVSYSNFGQSGWGIGPSGGVAHQEEGPESATRFTAVYLSGTFSGAYFNTISYAGTAGISLEGTNQVAYGNTLTENRYEQPDGHPGGHLTLWTGFIRGKDSTDAAIASNTINGYCWPGYLPASGDKAGQCIAGQQIAATGCPTTSPNWPSAPPPPGFSGGIEANGWGHVFYNNEVAFNAGGGIAVNLKSAGECPNGPRSQACMEGHLAITSNNPWYVGDNPKFVEQNTWNGITVWGPSGNYNSFQGVTLDNILVRANAAQAVYLEGVSADPPYTGFINGACLYPSPDHNQNTGGTVISTAPPAGAMPVSLLNSYGSIVTPTQQGYLMQFPGFLSGLQSGICPDPSPVQAPAAWFPANWPH